MAFDPADHVGLLLDGLGAIDEGGAPLLCQGNGHGVVGNGLHDGRDHGDVHGEGAFLPLAEPHDGGSQADVGGNAVCGGIAGNQQVFTKGVGGFFKIVCHVNSFKMVDDVIV